MKTVKFLVAGVSTLIAVSGGSVFAEDVDVLGAQEEIQTRVEMQEQLYGSELMTPQERIEQRAKMRAANTAEERALIRKEHHQRMEVRAREQGVILPEAPVRKGGKGDCDNKGQKPSGAGRGR